VGFRRFPRWFGGFPVFLLQVAGLVGVLALTGSGLDRYDAGVCLLFLCLGDRYDADLYLGHFCSFRICLAGYLYDTRPYLTPSGRYFSAFWGKSGGLFSGVDFSIMGLGMASGLPLLLQDAVFVDGCPGLARYEAEGE
jgi:hypothetical protein